MPLETLSQENERRRLSQVDRLTAPLGEVQDPVLKGVVELVRAHLKVPTVLISVVDRNVQWFAATAGSDLRSTPRQYAFCAHALAGDGLFEVLDATTHPLFSANPLVTHAPYIRYYAGMPLQVSPGISLGSLCILDSAGRPPLSEHDQSFMQHAAHIVVARLETLNQQHHFDPLTGLHNRQGLNAAMNSTDPERCPLAAILIEPLPATAMDSLVKAMGYVIFEQFMLAVKETLLCVLPATAKLFKPNTLSFAVMTPFVDRATLDELLLALTRAFTAPLQCGGVPVFADLGMGVLPPDAKRHWQDPVRLMACMIETGRNQPCRWAYYDPAVDSALQRSTTLLNAIEAALTAQDQLHLVYQPRVNLQTGTCRSVEALIRWAHPSMGAISPVEFIPLAERTASIRNITRWVVNRVFQQQAHWRTRGIDVTVSLNVSALDLTDSRLYEEIVQASDRWGISASVIELEFTESMLVKDFTAVRHELENLQALGVYIGIDDFGSGYSNWAYLRDIPASCVKLDRSLLNNLAEGSTNWHIVRGLLSLIRDLKLEAVAEGIETEAHHRLLQSWGCEEGQGYFFSRPLEPSAFEQWLTQSAQPDTQAPAVAQ